MAEVHPDHAKTATEVGEQCLIYDVYHLLDKLYNYKFSIPLGCEVKIGEHWGEGKGVKFEYQAQRVEQESRGTKAA